MTNSRRSTGALLACATLGCVLAVFNARMLSAQAATQPATASPTATITLLGYHTKAPSGWTARTPGSSMRLAEFAIPNTAGTVPRNDSSNAEVVIYFFGAGQGGGADANLERWKSQFSTPDGSPVYERISKDTSGASPLTVAEYRGTYARGIGAGSAAEDARKNNTLIAVVAETPRGTLFFQLFGPTAAVDRARTAFLTMVRGLR